MAVLAPKGTWNGAVLRWARAAAWAGGTLLRAPRKEPVPDEVLQTAYRVATGEIPTSKEITKRVVELGGDVDVGPDGEVRYRFADLEAEAEALEEEREGASDREARFGKIVFTSEG